MPRTRAQSTAAAMSVPSAVENVLTSQNAKRAALDEPQGGQPSRKRVVFGDITNAFGNVVLNSSKKTAVKSRAARLPTKGAAPLATISPSELEISASPPRRATRSSTASATRNSSGVSGACGASSLQVADSVPKPIDPAPDTDYDAGLLTDPFNVPHYAMDIFRYYRTREARFAVDDYMRRQRELDASMRSMLVDWMVEIQENFELNHETLYMAVKLVDLYLARVSDTTKDQLQLVGAAALFIAAKVDERSPPLADDFLYICDDAYTRDELMAMERQLLVTVGFDICMPLSYRYLRRFAKATQMSMQQLTLARYILETALMHYQFVGQSEALLAAGALALAGRMHEYSHPEDPAFVWTPIHEKYTEMSWPTVAPMVDALNAALRAPREDNAQTVHNKYSHAVFFSVAVKYAPLP